MYLDPLQCSGSAVGTNVILTCIVTYGYLTFPNNNFPHPTLRWSKDGDWLSESIVDDQTEDSARVYRTS